MNATRECASPERKSQSRIRYLAFAVFFGLGVAYVLLIQKGAVSLDAQRVTAGVGFIIPFMISSFLVDYLAAKPLSFFFAFLAGAMGFAIGSLASPAWVVYVACALFTGICLVIGWYLGRPSAAHAMTADAQH